MSEIARSLAVLSEPPGGESARLASLLDLPEPPPGWVHTKLFLEQLYPYASVYLDGAGKLGGEARDRVAGFWRALGQPPPAEPDHLSTLLGAYAELCEAGAAATEPTASAAWERARAALLWEHLLSWLPLWLAKLDELDDGFYRAWGRMLAGWLQAEAARTTLPQDLPAHLRDAPDLRPPGDDAQAFLDDLLCPVRTGFILTHSDLRQLARDTGLGLRVGERRYVLEALLSQDAAATLRGLAALAHRGPVRDDTIGAFWSSRAAVSAALLTRLADDATS